MIGQRVGSRSVDIFVLETANPVELRFVHPIQQVLELRLGLTGIAHDESRAQGDVGADVAPFGDPVQGALGCGRTGHAFQRVRMAVLERDVEIGQDQPIGHQRDQLARMRIGIYIVQPHPQLAICAKRTKIAGQFGDRHLIAACAVFPVYAIGRRVLADHQKLFHSAFDQFLGFAHHRIMRAADQFAAHVRDDAELALVIATFRNL